MTTPRSNPTVLQLPDRAQLINGQWVGADCGTTLAVLNPATGTAIAEVPRSGAAETRRAINAADAALKLWSARTANDRCAVLRALTDLLITRREDLALLLTLEQGKPLAEARTEIDQSIAFFRWYAEEGRRHLGEVIPADRPGRRLSVIRHPVGVVAAITPWNFPSSMVARKVAPALAAGCTVVLKPAGETPLSALALGALALEVGVPPGVFNVVTGNPSEIGAELTGNALVRKLTFTGSTAIGKMLAAQCAATVKRLSLELGGNAPFIVFDDADLDAAVEGALASRFRNAGQTCVAANRLLVQGGIHDRFVAALTERVRALAVGAGVESETQIGPLINEVAVAKVTQLLTDAVADGAELVYSAQTPTGAGAFMAPGVLAGVSDVMAVARDEIFGPVAAVLKFDTEEEAIERANNTPYGLAAYFYTSDRRRQVRVSEALEYGMVGVNECLVAYEGAPFGGVKESGMGREGSHHGLDDYTELKYVCEGGLN